VLELAFSPDDVARIRFAFSPIWEAVVSVRVLRGPAERALHLPWVRRVRAAIDVAQPDFGLLADLVPTPVRYIPDFLTPPPSTPVPVLDAELDALRATSPDQVRHDLDRVPGRRSAKVAELYADPVAGVVRLAEQIRGYWELALAPHWPRIRGLLEGEVSFRARRLAAGGAHLLFHELHERIRWDTDRLYVRHRYYRSSRALDGRGLVLVPSVFAWPSVYTISTPPWQPTLLYPPRGVATLWEAGAAAGPDALAGVLGQARAVLLTQLAAPASTTELARRTGLTPGGVSQHLTALRRAGLVVSYRAGRAVLYARTEVADALLRAAGAD
jgi:DNA-binding transcriptional ArsR family regulator